MIGSFKNDLNQTIIPYYSEYNKKESQWKYLSIVIKETTKWKFCVLNLDSQPNRDKLGFPIIGSNINVGQRICLLSTVESNGDELYTSKTAKIGETGIVNAIIVTSDNDLRTVVLRIFQGK